MVHVGRNLHLSARDWRDLRSRGVGPAEVVRQARLLQNPPPPPETLRPCTVGDGIERFSVSRRARLVRLAGEALRLGRLSRFVPASGAATRLFSSLLLLDHERKTTNKRVRSVLQENEESFARESARFFSALPRLALHEPLRKVLATRRLPLGRLLAQKEYDPILDALLDGNGMAMAGRPKGLIPFHFVGNHPISAFEEHLREALPLADHKRCVRAHFTVAREFLGEIKKLGQSLMESYRRRYGVRLDLEFSLQHSATDTLALEPGKGLVRGKDGRVLLRPGGHGALLTNLERTRGDIVLIKNIDNVPVWPFHAEGNAWRVALAGRLVEAQNEANGWLRILHGKTVSLAQRVGAEKFLKMTLGRSAPPSFSLSQRVKWMVFILNRPWRVCGMVPNKGEPGGGPFWVKSPNGDSRQILEVSQLGPHQKRFTKNATHFNPVDLVVGLRDGRGRSFSLDRYADLSQVIVGRKHFEGREIRTLEHPGLWNGGMAHWNTIFVEIPLKLFHPVKTITDLLRPGHCVRGRKGRRVP